MKDGSEDARDNKVDLKNEIFLKNKSLNDEISLEI